MDVPIVGDKAMAWLLITKGVSDSYVVTATAPDDPASARLLQDQARQRNDYNKGLMDDLGEASHRVFGAKQFVIHSSEMDLFPGLRTYLLDAEYDS